MLSKATLFTKIVLLVLATFGCRTLVIAQDTDFYFTRFTPANGLASSEINALYQDAGHLIWIGHKAGISRYNGYHFDNILYAGDQRIGNVYSITEMGGAVWIGSEAGLFSGNDKFVGLAGKLPAVYSLATDKQQRLWIGTADDLVVLSPKDSIDFHFYKKPEGCGLIKFISVADSNAVYISDGYSIFLFGEKGSQSIYRAKDNRDYITGLHANSRDVISLSSQLSGFRVLRNGVIEGYSFSKGIGNALSFSNNRLLYFAVEGIYAIDVDSAKTVQLASIPLPYREWGSAVWQDREDNIWIGTHEELLLARPRLFHHTQIPGLTGFDELYSAYHDADGSILFGGNRGKVFKKQNKETAPVLLSEVFPLAEVFDIHHAATGDTWFCSGYQGLSRLHIGKLQRFTVQDGLRHNSNYKFLNTSSGELFVCGDNGISQILTAADGSVSFKNYGLQTNGGKAFMVKSMLEKPGHGLLLGSDIGLLEWKNDSIIELGLKSQLPEKPSVTDIKQDASGNIWISTIGSGILVCRFDSTSQLVPMKKFTETDGLSAMIYLQLHIDKNNTVWAAGYKEVTAIREKTEKDFRVNSFALNPAFADNSFHSVRMLQDKEGMIHMATSSGLISFNPATISHTSHLPVVQIKDIHFPPGKALSNKFAGILPPDGFELPYDFGSVTFQFTGIYFSDPASVRYAYRLAGYDSDWTEGIAERSVVFQNLPPGDYTFEVKAAAGNSTWSKPVAYRFSVLSPFWMSGWFILTVIAVVLASLFGFIRYRESMIRKKEAEKTEIEQLKAISYQYQLEIEQVVNYFATVISQQKNIDDLLWDVTRNCMSKLGFEDCVIYLKEEGRNVLVQKAAWGPKTTEENKILNPIEIQLGKGIVGHVAQAGKSIIVTDTRKDARYIVDDLHRLSEIAVPITSDNKVMGVIDSEHSQTAFYTDRHLQILTTIAALCADKINKIRADEKTRAKEIEVIKLNSDLLSSQLTALRSQMNPHFIFNSLNSIAQLVASMQNELGLEYLNKFASLLRLILEESENNFISLKDEIRLLDLYLQLESLRFGSSFIYHIDADDSLDMEDTMLPSFIIHPIVENAIWHGLLHREGERRLDIEFQKKNNESLLCIVKDNGIGVAAAKAMKQKSPVPGKQQSKGLQMVIDRLHILGQEHNTPANMIIEDVKENGFAGGTKVTIHLPVIYDL